MARRTDADFDVALRGTGVIDRSARAGDFGLVVIGMDVRFHDREKDGELTAAGPTCKGRMGIVTDGRARP